MDLISKKNKKKPLILIVDDIPKNIQVLGNFLLEQEYELSVATSGKQALELVKLLKPDLILLDIMMPEMDGFEVCNEIKNNEELKEIPIIFLTAKSEIKDIKKGFSLGAVDYIVKPFNLDEVLARINTHLELKFSKQQLKEYSLQLEEINNKISNEITIASEYFKSLLPQPFEDEFVKFNWKYKPSMKLGGDMFGYNKISDNYIFYLYDVCGHGIASTLFSINVMNILKNEIEQISNNLDPTLIFNNLNQLFQITDHKGYYFTIWLLIYNSSTKEITYSSAGHHSAIIIDENGNSNFINKGNFIIGGKKNYMFKSDKMHLNKNTIIYLFSDGTFNFQLNNNNIWTINNLKDFLTARVNENNKELNDLYEFIKNSSNNNTNFDDFTIVKIKFK